jgi:serine/threonine-protein kinase
MLGREISHYRVLSRLGEGAMGEVYRARDTKLDRDVAIKILPRQFTADPERIARFEREARLLAALNHQHIAAIYGIENLDGTPALILEFVPGETLADRLAPGAVSARDAIDIARQVAEALEAAHEGQIIHRDLKPANVKITADGVVKVLDFGLAKALSIGPSEADTVAVLATHAGTILGTGAYMSPEQARGQPVDRRTDIWSFGALVFELLSGRRAFEGSTLSDTLANVLTKEPDWTLLPHDTPPNVVTLIRRCLVKDRRNRLDSAAAIRLELSDSSPTASTGAPWRRPRVAARAMAALVILTIGALAGAALASRMLSASRNIALGPTEFSVEPAGDQALALFHFQRSLAVSPDARVLAYIASGGRLVIRRMDRIQPEVVPGVEGAFSPFFSPDSRWIAFFTVGELKKVPVDGGNVITICRDLGDVTGGTWSDEGVIIFAGNPIGLRMVSAEGGRPTQLTSEPWHFDPAALPRGHGVLFSIWSANEAERTVALLDLHSHAYRTLIRGGFAASYVEPGYLVYEAAGTLFAVPFDLDRLQVTGNPRRIRDDLRLTTDVRTAGTSYAVAGMHALVYVPASAESRSLVWVDRNGRETAINAPARAYWTLKLSPNGQQLAYSDGDLWTLDLVTATSTRLTSDAGTEFLPIWTAEGRRIVYSADRSGAMNLYLANADGSGVARQLTSGTTNVFANSVTHDGTTILGSELRPNTGYDVVRFSVSDGARQVVLGTPAAEFYATLSPDERYLAYQATESGRMEIFARRYPGVDAGRWQVSSEGGSAPTWAQDGRELFYLDLKNRLMAVPVEATATGFHAGTPHPLFAATYWGDFYSYDVSPDGSRFLMIKENERVKPVVVTLNWGDWLNGLGTAGK